MAVIHVEGRPYEVKEGQHLLAALLTLGFDLPYFCWHPALGSVGACRQCAVKQYQDANDEQGILVMACMTPVQDGMYVSVDDPDAVSFRRAIIEWLMLNHPHDCPVCDEGGECHLQDMTVMSGHTYRRTRFPKRTFRNQDLGPFLHQEMNRCIHCYRCVRFYRDYAGGGDLQPFGTRNQITFARCEDGPLENPFSGNLVEICPTGVFTDETFRKHSSRKWDLQTSPSVCIHCALGCNTIIGERYGALRRISNRYHPQINGYFLCDRGRFGYEFVNREDRLREVRGEALGDLLQRTPAIGIGSPRASLESNYALRSLVGAERFSIGVSDLEARLITSAREILTHTPARVPTLREVEEADAILVLGEDVTNLAPRLDLALRQAVRRQLGQQAAAQGITDWNAAFLKLIEDVKRGEGNLFILSPAATALDGIARRTHRALPGEVARLGFEIAHTVKDSAPAASELVSEIATVLSAAKRPLIVTGTGCLDVRLLRAASNLARVLSSDDRRAGLVIALPECNSLGVSYLGNTGVGVALEALARGEAETLVVLENDLHRRADSDAIEVAIEKARHLVVIDHRTTPLAERADIVLPAATFDEAAGTLLNSEGRLQRFWHAHLPDQPIRAAWRWLGDWKTITDLRAELAQAIPELGGLSEPTPETEGPVPRQSPRYSGRTSMHAHHDVHEKPPPPDPDSPLVFTMEGQPNPSRPELLSRYWAPGWNSVQALTKFQVEVGGMLRGGDPGRRIIEPTDEGNYYASPREDAAGGFVVIPLHLVFGSEELSARAPAVRERVPSSFIALNEAEARRLGVQAGETLSFSLAGRTWTLPLAIRAELPDRAAGLPVGLPGVPPITETTLQIGGRA